VFLLTILLFLAAIEVGFRFGHYRRLMPSREDEAPSGAMVGATLGLLGFMLAMTFSMAGNRYDARKELVLKEANAIGTAYLRARMLPEPQSTRSRDLLRKYVDVRLFGARKPEEVVGLMTETALEGAIRDSVRIHDDLWSNAEELAAADPHSIVLGLFTQSLNDVIDLHSDRVIVGIRHRIPVVIWFTLILLSVLSMVALGFHGGLSSPRRSVATLLVTFAFVAVLSLIVDLDRGQEGFLTIDQRPLFDVRDSMGPPR
jgi:hypothetical protein